MAEYRRGGGLRNEGTARVAWTASDIPDLSGKTAIVTGANSGLGFETAKALAEHGASVILACRDRARCEGAAQRLRNLAPAARLEPMMLDLADLDSVRGFAAAFGESHDTLDILVNNAGVMAPPHRLETKQGFELQFGTNHLGHFALTGLLMAELLRAPGSRVVTVSSFAHETGEMHFDDLQLERGYTPYGAYSQSKLSNLLFMSELDRRLKAAGAGTLSVGAHPGFASTRLQATGPFMGSKPLRSWLTLAAVRVVGQSARRGAEPQLFAATAPSVAGGDYFGPKHLISGHPMASGMSARARDAASAARLWEVSEALTGVAY
jgi:NAD(P)-dependent dehydrogenase (short-subunit alcohol dehydrogenase family)